MKFKILTITLLAILMLESQKRAQFSSEVSVAQPHEVARYDAPEPVGKPTAPVIANESISAKTSSPKDLTDAQIKQGNIKFENDIKFDGKIQFNNEPVLNLTDLKAKYESDLKTLTKSTDIAKTEQALNRVNDELAKQTPKSQSTSQEFDMSPTTSHALSFDHTSVLKSNEGGLGIEAPKNVENTTLQTLTSEELTILENASEAQFKNGNRKESAENALTTIDAHNDLPDDVRNNLEKEFEAGPKNGQSWSDFFKSMYEKIIKAVNDAIASTKTAITGKSIETTIDPITKNQIKTKLSKNIRLKSTVYDAKGRILNENEYDPTGKIVTKSTVYEYDSTGKQIKSEINEYDNTGKITMTTEYDSTGNIIQKTDFLKIEREKTVRDNIIKEANKKTMDELDAANKASADADIAIAKAEARTDLSAKDQSLQVTAAKRLKTQAEDAISVAKRTIADRAAADKDPEHIGAQTIYNPIDTTSNFTILGLKPGASKTEITKASRDLSRIHHPDRNPLYKDAATSNMKIINDAVQNLKQSLS